MRIVAVATMRENIVGKVGWVSLISALVVQLGAVALYLDSDPFQTVPRDAVRITPSDGACAEDVRQGVVAVPVNASRMSGVYVDLVVIAFVLNAITAIALWGSHVMARRNKGRESDDQPMAHWRRYTKPSLVMWARFAKIVR